MIQNDLQYNLTKKWIERFENDSECFTKESINDNVTSPLLIKAQIDSMRSQLYDLYKEVEEYKSLRERG